MLDNKRKISNLIETQLPRFINDEYENFGKFLRSYYEQLEVQGQPLDVINNLDKYLDIGTFSKEVLKDQNVLAANITATDTEITLEDGRSFPKRGGYVRIDQEICFYTERSGNVLKGVTRGVSGNMTLGNLYEESNFVSTESADHYLGAPVYNVSNLFLYAIVRSFELQYLDGFPEKYLSAAADKRTLIKHVGDFYKSKGSEKSIKFIFNSVLTQAGEDDEVSTYNPKDFTIKASTSNWTKLYSLRVKSYIGDPMDLVGKRIEQVQDDLVVSATVDNVRFYKNINGDALYDIILAEETVSGLFTVAQRTCLIGSVSSAATTGDRIKVLSTQGWKGQQGSLLVGSEVITFNGRSSVSFTIDRRSSTTSYSIKTPVYGVNVVKAENIQCIPTGLVYDLSVSNGTTLSKVGDVLQTTTALNKISSGNPKEDKWYLENPSNPNYILPGDENSALSDKYVEALFEDDEFYYVCSGGQYKQTPYTPDIDGYSQVHQNFLRLIRKNPVTTTEKYDSGDSDVGISLTGLPILSSRDSEYVIFGSVESFEITNKGKNYQNPPTILLDNRPGYAVATLSGNTIGSITSIKEGAFTKDPVITITSGRKATASATVTNGKVTKIDVIQPGEYYVTPPIVRIIDGAGRGRFAEYTTEIDTRGRVVGFTAVNEGNFYSQENIQVEIVPVGENAAATCKVKRWYKEKSKKILASNPYGKDYDLVSNNGQTNHFKTISLQSSDINIGGYYTALLGNSLSTAPTVLPNNAGAAGGQDHSELLGFAYDGNPIYGAFGHEDPLDAGSSSVRMLSGYKLRTSRVNGPSTSTYALGTFVDDYYYEYDPVNYGKTVLDENNGRYCVTPEYPGGTYAYFVSTDANFKPVYPWFVGPTYYSVPAESNYKQNLSQKDLPRNVKRIFNELESQFLPLNYDGGTTTHNLQSYSNFINIGQETNAVVDAVQPGGITGVFVNSSSPIFSAGSEVFFESPGGTEVGASGIVSTVKGKDVSSLESQEQKAVKLRLTTPAYLFDGDILTQENTGANGLILGNIVNGTDLVLTNTTGTFNNDDLYTSSTEVLSILLTQDSSYTESAVISWTDGDNVLATGTVLDGTIRQNSVRLRVDSGSFYALDWEPLSTYQNGDYILYDDNVYRVNPSNSSAVEAEVGNAAPTHRNGSVVSGGAELEFVAREPYLQSDKLIDTVASAIVSVTSLSSGLVPFSINNNIAVARTSEPHGLSVGSFVDVKVDPDEAFTYQVRRKTFQKVSLNPVYANTLLKNSGVGRVDILNTGQAYFPDTYLDVELLFLDQEEVRDGIGRGGDPANATATVIVGPDGTVSSVQITNPGYGYAKGDLLTITSGTLGGQGLPGIPNVILQVDHAGFARENTVLQLRELTNISENDQLKIYDEVVLVTDVDQVNKQVTVARAQEGTVAADHYFNEDVSIHNPRYRFTAEQRLGSSVNDPKVISYDTTTHELLVSYDYTVDASNANLITFSSIFRDESSPQKSVSISTVEDAVARLEFSNVPGALESDFTPNPIIPVQQYHKYVFDVSHFSMDDQTLIISPSKNGNIFTKELSRNLNAGERFVSVLFGYKVRDTNTINGDVLGDWSKQYEREELNYTNYYYFSEDDDGNKTTETEGSYLQVVKDPLQGQQTVDYVSDTAFAYLLDVVPQTDGNGTISYTTSSSSSIGEIDSIRLNDFGSGYKSVPQILGVLPDPKNEAKVTPTYNAETNTITSVTVDTNGDGYINPKIVVSSGGGSGYQFQVLTNNSKVVRVIVSNGGTGYTTTPVLKVVEDIDAYAETDSIGVPTNIRITDNGGGYNTDYSLTPTLRTYYKLKIEVPKDHDTVFGRPAVPPVFYKGETVKQASWYYDDQSYEPSYDPGVIYYQSNYFEEDFTVVEWLEDQSTLIVTGKRKPALTRTWWLAFYFYRNQIKVARTPSTAYNVTSVEYFDYDPNIFSYYDNIGRFDTDTGRLNNGTQKLTDSFFYQDYSYVVKSRKSINEYRDLLKNSTHPAGFQMFGEMLVDSEAKNAIPEDAVSHNTVKIITLYDDNSNLVTTSIVKERASQSISNVSVVDSYEERGRGSIQIDDFNLSETVAKDIKLNENFDGRYQAKTGQLEGTTTFTLIDVDANLPFVPYNENELVVTLDGVLQEPGVSYTVSGTKITFTEPPRGPFDDTITYEDGSKILPWASGATVNAGDFVWHTNGIVYLVLTGGTLGSTEPTHTTGAAPNGTASIEYSSQTKYPGVRFYARSLKFKEDSLNQKYLRRFKNIFQRDGRWIDAANQIEKNKKFIQEETIGYLKETHSNINWNLLEQKCKRDIGHIVDGYAKDLRFGGNSYSISNGKLYYDGTVLDHIEDQLTETLDGFAYAARLCKLAMRNWDYTYDEVTYFQGSDIMVVDDTSNVAVGMYVSAGNSYPDGTVIDEIISDTELRLSNSATGAAGSELITTDTDITVDTTTATTTVGVSATLRVFDPFFYRVTTGGSNQATFYLSGVNTGTYYDAANLILANKENIQREAPFAITDGYQLFQYPEQPLEASIFKDARRLIYKNIDFLADYTLERIDAQYPGFNYGGGSDGRIKCRRDIVLIIDAVATDLGRSSNENMVAAAKLYFDDDNNLISNGLLGELEEGIFGYTELITIINQVITNQGAPGGSLDGFTTLTGRSAFYDLGIVADPISGDNTVATNCSDVRAAVDTLIQILITSLDDARQGNPVTFPTINTGNSTWYKMEDKCKRDIGLLVNDVAYHLKFGGNRKIVEFGKFYYEGRTSGLSFIGPEVDQTVYAFNKARDLMILAMRNTITGDTVINPVVDTDVAIDPNSPECADVESSITTMAQIVEDTLTVGKDLYVATPENDNFPGKWSTTTSYSNYDIIDDPLIVASECDDVASAIDLIYSALNTTLSVGKDAAPLSLPDYIDGKNTRFDLYYDDGTDAVLDENERLMITLSGVLQTAKHLPNTPLEDAYYIDRTNVPNQVVFTTPPLWDQNDNVKELQEPLAIDTFSARSIGSYERITIDESAITGKTGGPFIMRSVKDGKVKVTGDYRYSLVFVDGVLQEYGKSYTMSGPTISFTEPLQKSDTGQYSKVNILLFYGKDLEKTATIFDHEQNTYYNKCTLTISGAGTYTSFANWNRGYEKIVVKQDDNNGETHVIGLVRDINVINSTDWELILVSQTPKFDPSIELKFQPNTSDLFTGGFSISGATISLTYNTDVDGARIMQRDTTKWLFGSGLNDEAWAVKNKLLANLLPGDTIKIDGEDDFRSVISVPSTARARNHLPGTQASNQYYGTLGVTNYSGRRSGEGLSITPIIDTNTGRVVDLEWDDNSLQLYFEQGLLSSPTAYQYFYTPVINFVSVDGTGGGATAEVIVSGGQIVDVHLSNPGAGYTKPPEVKVSRGYVRIKENRKFDPFFTLGLENKVGSGVSLNAVAYVTIVPPRIIPTGSFYVDVRMGTDLAVNANEVRKITTIIDLDTSRIENNLAKPFEEPPIPIEKVSKIEAGAGIKSVSTVTRNFVVFKELEITGTSEITKEVEIFDSVDTGMVDTGTNTYELDYDGGVLGNRTSTMQSMMFVGGGVIVNGVTFEEWDRLYPTMSLEDWADPIYEGTSITENLLWNLGMSTETQYMTFVDTTAVPGPGDPGYLATGAVVYVGSTSSFPSTGTIIVGREKISYTGKLSDRFIGVTRGVDGTSAEAHPLLEYVRTIDP